jgi:hypothetical protein
MNARDRHGFIIPADPLPTDWIPEAVLAKKLGLAQGTIVEYLERELLIHINWRDDPRVVFIGHDNGKQSVASSEGPRKRGTWYISPPLADEIIIHDAQRRLGGKE